MAVPNIFANVTTSIPLSQLDTNFATAITLGNTAVYLGNTTTTLGNLTLTNVNIVSGTSNIASTPTSIANGTSNVSVVSSGGNVVVSTNGSNAVFIDTSQNVGISSAPSGWSGFKALDIGSVSSLWGQSSGNGTSYYSNNLYYNGSARIYKTTGNASEYTQGGGSHQWYYAASGTAGNSVSLSEAMRIDSSGYVGIGTNSPSSYGGLAVRKGKSGTFLGFTANSSIHSSDGINSSFYVLHNNENSGTTFLCTDAGGRLQMFCSNTGSGGVYLGNGGSSWSSASDERVKENLVPIADGLTKVASLRAVTGNYINDETKKSRAFLIAQDVQAVLPEAIDSSNPNELGLAYTDVIPLLVASIKELKAINDTQAETINALTARIVALESK